MGSRQQVVLGVICDPSGSKALVARRAPGSHLGGFWEFPGGKVRPGEAALAALKRELHEEVNIEVGGCTPLLSFDYDYPDRSLHFKVWKIHDWAGAATGKAGQETRWLDLSALSVRDFPPANRGIINACRLPPLYLITPPLQRDPAAAVKQLQEYLAAGVKLVQFRSKTAPHPDSALAQMIDACTSAGAELLVNATPELALRAGAAGVHLNSQRLRQTLTRPLPAASWVAASCHDLDELRHAALIGVDFCVLSPVRKPTGKDGMALGWERFSDLVGKLPIPVYALGGMKLSDLEQARQYGAQGIALISDVWSRADAAARLGRLHLG